MKECNALQQNTVQLLIQCSAVWLSLPLLSRAAFSSPGKLGLLLLRLGSQGVVPTVNNAVRLFFTLSLIISVFLLVFLSS